MKSIINKLGYTSRKLVVGIGVGMGVATAAVGIFTVSQLGGGNGDITGAALGKYVSGGSSNGGAGMSSEELSAKLAAAESARRGQQALYTTQGGITAPRGGGEIDYGNNGSNVQEAGGGVAAAPAEVLQPYAGDTSVIESMGGSESGIRGVDSEAGLVGLGAGGRGRSGNVGRGVRNLTAKENLSTSQTQSGDFKISGGNASSSASGSLLTGGGTTGGAGNVSGPQGNTPGAFGMGRAGALGGSNIGGASGGGLGAGQSGAGGLMASLGKAQRLSTKAGAQSDVSKKEAAAGAAFDGSEVDGVSVDADAQVADGTTPDLPNIDTSTIGNRGGCTGADCDKEVKELEAGIYKDIDQLIKDGRAFRTGQIFTIGVSTAWRPSKIIEHFKEYLDIDRRGPAGKLSEINKLEDKKAAKEQYEIVEFMFYRYFMYMLDNRPKYTVKGFKWQQIVGKHIDKCSKENNCSSDKSIVSWYKNEMLTENKTNNMLYKLRDRSEERRVGKEC
jgi:hypothetical protein